MREIKISGLKQQTCWAIKKKIDETMNGNIVCLYEEKGRQCDLILRTYRFYKSQKQYAAFVFDIVACILNNREIARPDDKEQDSSAFVVDPDNLNLGL